MRFLFLILAFMLTFTAHAGFEGLNQDVSLKLFNRINCGEGIECTKVKDKFTIAFDGTSGASTLVPQVLATATTITAAQCGSTFYNAGAIEMELPEASAVLGCRLTFVVMNATAFNIDPDAADIILYSTNVAGDRLVADAVGESIVLEAISASQWAVVGGANGTWTDNN